MDGDRSRPMSSSRTPGSSALGAGGTGADRALPRRPRTATSQTPAGTFCAAGCGPLQPGTAHAFGDRLPVPDGVEGPRPQRHVPTRDVGPDHEWEHSHRPPGPPYLQRPALHPSNHHGPASGTNKRAPHLRCGTAGVGAPAQTRCSLPGEDCSRHSPTSASGHRTSSVGGILLPDPPS